MKKEEYKRLASLVERAKQLDPRIKNAREAEKLRSVFILCVWGGGPSVLPLTPSNPNP